MMKSAKLKKKVYRNKSNDKVIELLKGDNIIVNIKPKRNGCKTYIEQKQTV